MQIREITDKKIWEEFIARNAPQSLFQSWNWGEVRRAMGKKFWRLGIYENKKLLGISFVEKVVAKRGTFLHLRHGPILTGWNKKYLLFFLEYVKELGEKNSACFIRMSPLISDTTDNRELFNSLQFKTAPIIGLDGGVCWVLDLTPSEEELLSGMRKTTRYLVRQAQKLGVMIKTSTNVKDIKSFLTLYKQTARRQRFVTHDGIEEEFEIFQRDDQVVLYQGFYDDKLLAAALVIFYNNQAIYHHSASIEQKIPVNYLLQWEIIREAKRRQKEFYNFWGVSPDGKPRHPWSGLSSFKKGFGGNVVTYLPIQDLPLTYKYYFTFFLETYRKWAKGY
jgi:lipid II:glycine glycyltransferase (peptidoglycan interpeptide bridge formation enzyme)